MARSVPKRNLSPSSITCRSTRLFFEIPVAVADCQCNWRAKRRNVDETSWSEKVYFFAIKISIAGESEMVGVNTSISCVTPLYVFIKKRDYPLDIRKPFRYTLLK